MDLKYKVAENGNTHVKYEYLKLALMCSTKVYICILSLLITNNKKQRHFVKWLEIQVVNE